MSAVASLHHQAKGLGLSKGSCWGGQGSLLKVCATVGD